MKKINTEEEKRERKIKKTFAVYAVCVLMVTIGTIPVYANEALNAVNNLSDFVFSLIRAIGIILSGFGMLQVGMSIKSHDPSQRANGFMTLAGGLVILFAKEILNAITGGV